MNRPPDNTPELPGFSLTFPATVLPTGRADGGVLVIPGKPVLDEEFVSVKQAARLTGYSKRTVQRLAHKELGGRQRKKRCKIRIPAREVRRLKEGR